MSKKIYELLNQELKCQLLLRNDALKSEYFKKTIRDHRSQKGITSKYHYKVIQINMVDVGYKIFKHYYRTIFGFWRCIRIEYVIF